MTLTAFLKIYSGPVTTDKNPNPPFEKEPNPPTPFPKEEGGGRKIKIKLSLILNLLFSSPPSL